MTRRAAREGLQRTKGSVDDCETAKNKIKGMSDMKKIKTKLVTFITDNVRLVDKNLVGRIG